MNQLPSGIRLVSWAVLAILLGLSLALLDRSGDWSRGWLAYGVLLTLAIASLLAFDRLLSAGEGARRAAFTAFFIRLAVGIALTLLLPSFGYQNEDAIASQAGYFYNDAYTRDQQAWKLAGSEKSLTSAFSSESQADQYGGMLFISSLVYRFLSPDAHRQMLILVICAAAGAWGVFFLWKVAQDWFGESTAAIAGWIFALYPESVLLGASQMREGFVFSAVAMAVYGIVSLLQRKRSWWIPFGAAYIILFLFHPPTALVGLVVLGGIWLFDPSRKRLSGGYLFLFIAILFVAIFAVVVAWSRLPSLQGMGPVEIFTRWLQNNFNFQAHLTQRASGRIQQLVKQAGTTFAPAIITIYGVAQPVLPAAIFDPAPAIWVTVNILRAAGWYALAPLLVYGLFTALRAQPGERCGQMIWIASFSLIWILLSSANSGGDLWDGPRYRAIFLAFQAILAAWAWRWAYTHRDAWLNRLLIVEGVFLLFFTEWYASRYTQLIGKPLFWQMIAAILILSVLVLLAGWVWDRRKSREGKG